MDLGFWTFAGTLAIGFILGAGTLYGLSFLFSAEDETLLLIQGKLNSIEQIGRSLLKQMATALELLTTANETLDKIDEATTNEGNEIKELADAYEALKAEIGKDNPEVVAALEGLNARLVATGERVTKIYTKPEAAEVPEETPVEEAPVEEAPAETEETEG